MGGAWIRAGHLLRRRLGKPHDQRDHRVDLIFQLGAKALADRYQVQIKAIGHPIDAVRLSPHTFNTVPDIHAAVRALRSELGSRRRSVSLRGRYPRPSRP